METNTFRLVFAKHDDCPKDFLFSVPPNIALHKGDILLVDTAQGPAIAKATSEPFICNDINGLAVKLGAYLPLKNVIQAAGPAIQRYIIKQARTEIVNTVEYLDTVKENMAMPF